MVSVQLRDNGQGVWRVFLLPVTVLAAQTIAKAATSLKMADHVRIAPPEPPPSTQRLDLSV